MINTSAYRPLSCSSATNH